MDKLLLHKDELNHQFTRKKNDYNIKVEQKVKEEDLEIDPRLIFQGKVKNVPKKKYRKPKVMENNTPKNPFKMEMKVKSKY